MVKRLSKETGIYIGIIALALGAAYLWLRDFSVAVTDSQAASGDAAIICGRMPTPNHKIDFGYYFVYGKYGDFRSEVEGYTNLSLLPDSYFSDLTPEQWLPLFRAGLADAAAKKRSVFLPLSVEKNQLIVDQILDTAAPYWSAVKYIELADEPTWDRQTTEQWVRFVESKLTAHDLARKPIGAVYRYDRMLPDAINAVGLDWVGIEAYVTAPGSDVSAENVAVLNEQLRRSKAAVPAGKKIILVMMAYARNGNWTNIKTLTDLQMPTYLAAYNDPRVLAIAMFSYGRPSGTQEHQELKRPHQQIGMLLGYTRKKCPRGPGPWSL